MARFVIGWISLGIGLLSLFNRDPRDPRYIKITGGIIFLLVSAVAFVPQSPIIEMATAAMALNVATMAILGLRGYFQSGIQRGPFLKGLFIFNCLAIALFSVIFVGYVFFKNYGHVTK